MNADGDGGGSARRIITQGTLRDLSSGWLADIIV